MKWFSIWFWKYLFEKADNPHYCSKWTRFWCRAGGHKEGPIYYNIGGMEPDWRCKKCGDYLE